MAERISTIEAQDAQLHTNTISPLDPSHQHLKKNNHTTTNPPPIKSPKTMPTIPLHLPPTNPSPKTNPSNPLPPLLHTPTGLAILEIQGTLHLPNSPNSQPSSATTTPIGRLTFPDYSPQNPTSDEKWMKRVYLYVGRHQRLVGEVRRLERAVGVLRRREDKGVAGLDGEKEGLSGEGEGEGEGEGVEVVEIVHWKVLFGGRAEIVG